MRWRWLGTAVLAACAWAALFVPTPGWPPVRLPPGMAERMADLDKDGVVFVIPADEPTRRQLGRAIEGFLRAAEDRPATDDAGREYDDDCPQVPPGVWLVTAHEAVLGVAPAGAVGAGAGEGLVLLDPDGRKRVGGPLDLSSDEAVAASVRALLDREPFASARRGRVSRGEVEALRERLGDPNKSYAAELWGPDGLPVRLAPALIADLDPALEAAPSAEAASTAAGYRRGHLRRMLTDAIAATHERDGDATAVFGVQWSFEAYDPYPEIWEWRSEAWERRFVGFR